jgi:DNA-binding PadR family transcriptional regulator
MSKVKSLQDNIKSLTKLYILLILSSGSIHGYKLLKTLESIQGKKPSPANVYPFINSLAKEGYLKIKETGKRNKKIYELTQEGKQLVDSITYRIRNLVDLVFERNVKACVNCGCKIYEGGYRAFIKNKVLIFCCEHCYKNYSAN